MPFSKVAQSEGRQYEPRTVGKFVAPSTVSLPWRSIGQQNNGYGELPFAFRNSNSWQGLQVDSRLELRLLFFERQLPLDSMFVESEFSWTIMVRPDQFSISDRQLPRALMKNLLRRFSNTKCTEEHGYFVAVTGIENVGEGIIREGKGYITYPVLFRGLTYKPLMGEIVYGKVSRVSELGVIADCGPEQLAIIVKSGEISNMGEYKYHKEDKVWKHADDGRRIKQGTAIRAEISEITWLQHLKSFQTYCSLKRDFLGAVEIPSTT